MKSLRDALTGSGNTHDGHVTIGSCEAQRAAVVALLAPYLYHNPGCHRYWASDCTCGLEVVLNGSTIDGPGPSTGR